jgi:hypothetical protein
MVTADELACGFVVEIFLPVRRISALRRLKFYMRVIISSDRPPPPIPLKALPSAGFAKQVCQDLEPKGFRYQNLDSKQVTGLSEPLEPAASALTMMA